MSLPDSWVDALFARLTIRYGAAFMRQYADLDAAAVKADWGDVLAGFAGHPESIRYGLDNLPSDRPINAMQFRAICNGGPRSDPPAITNEVRAEPAKVAELVASVQRIEHRDMKQWARDLQERELKHGGELWNGRMMTRAQREMWREALRETA